MRIDLKNGCWGRHETSREIGITTEPLIWNTFITKIYQLHISTALAFFTADLAIFIKSCLYSPITIHMAIIPHQHSSFNDNSENKTSYFAEILHKKHQTAQHSWSQQFYHSHWMSHCYNLIPELAHWVAMAQGGTSTWIQSLKNIDNLEAHVGRERKKRH
jgi:hypothetical protein